MSSPKIVFFGTGNFSLPALKSLVEEKWNIAAVVTRPDSPSGRGQQLKAPPVKELASSLGLAVLQPANPTEIMNDLKAIGAEIGVVVAYGKMIPLEALELFPYGIINIHPSLLPRHRGASPVEGAILAGDTETGVSLMRINERMDQGPIFAQQTIKLSGNESKQSLLEELSKLGAQLLVQKLPLILNAKLEAKPQDDAQATFVKLIQKSDGQVDWKKPADQIEREVRAYLGWPGSHALLGHSEVIITSTHITEGITQSKEQKAGDVFVTETGELGVICGNGSVLVIDSLKPLGRTEMTGQAFLAGHQI